MIHLTIYKWSTFVLIFICIIGCTPEQEQEIDAKASTTDELGKITLDVTADEAPREQFIKGLLLLHSFEYEDAAEEFQKAQQLDSSFVMAYWGEAMTKNHPLWRQQNTEEARAILAKIDPNRANRLAAAPSELERDLLLGAELLFGDGTKEERDILYRDHMKSLREKYPENHEISSLYALSLLGAVKDGRDYEEYEKAANIAKSIIAENNQHPGALHYLIHAYDDPSHAAKALNAANNYSQVAPDAGHALHMPSHIYIAMGMWDEVIQSNIASYEASVTRMKRKGLDNNARGFHAFKWLMYARLQQGKFSEARQQLALMKEYAMEEGATSRTRSHFVQMRALYLHETGNWQDSIIDASVDISDLLVTMQAVDAFTKGMVGFSQKDQPQLSQVADELAQAIEASKKEVLVKGGKMCSGVSRYNQLPNQQDIDRSTIILHQLRAMEALLRKDYKAAETQMVKAVDLEDSVPFMFGPPEVIRPASEFYGLYLLEKGEVAAAKEQLEKVLERAPQRRIPSEQLANLKSI